GARRERGVSEAPLTVAVPSKGRLQENASAFFARAGLVLAQDRGARDYRGSLPGVADVEVLFLSASEIVSQLASGAAHLGVTGEDLVREGIADAAAAVELLTRLGFGQANVVAALRADWSERARTAAALVFTRIAAEEEARTTRDVRAALEPARPVDVAGLIEPFAATLPYGPPRNGEVVLRCRAEDAFG